MSRPFIIPKDATDKLTTEHPDWIEVTTIAGAAGFRCVTKGEYARFGSLQAQDGHKANEALCLMTLVYPSQEDWSAMVDAKPGIATTCANRIVQNAGYDMDAAVKKYARNSA